MKYTWEVIRDTQDGGFTYRYDAHSSYGMLPVPCMTSEKSLTKIESTYLLM